MSLVLPNSWRILDAASYLLNTGIVFGVGQPSALADKLGFKSNKEVSDMYPTLVTPSGWAFSIWGPIFLLEGYSSFATGVALCDDELPVSSWWRAACGLQAAWAICFAYGHDTKMLSLSSALIAGLAFCLRQVYFATQPAMELGSMTRLSFSMHSAWVNAAAIVNLNIVARALGLPLCLQIPFAIASELTAVTVGITTAVAQQDPVYACVTGWALVAIGKNKQNSDGKLHGARWTDTLSSLSSIATGLGYSCVAFGVWLAVRPMLPVE